MRYDIISVGNSALASGGLDRDVAAQERIYLPGITTRPPEPGRMELSEKVIQAYMGSYEISRREAIIMASRETPKIRLATYREWERGQGPFCVLLRLLREK